MKFSNKTLIILSFILVLLLFISIYYNYNKITDYGIEVAGIDNTMVSMYEVLDDKIVFTGYINQPSISNNIGNKVVTSIYFENDKCIKFEEKHYYSSKNNLRKESKSILKSLDYVSKKVEENILILERPTSIVESSKSNYIEDMLKNVRSDKYVFIKENGTIRKEYGKFEVGG